MSEQNDSEARRKITIFLGNTLRDFLKRYQRGTFDSPGAMTRAISEHLRARYYSVRGIFPKIDSGNNQAIRSLRIIVNKDPVFNVEARVEGFYFPEKKKATEEKKPKQPFNLSVKFWRQGDWFYGEISIGDEELARRRRKDKSSLWQALCATHLIADDVEKPERITTTPRVIPYVIEATKRPEPQLEK